MGASLLVLPSLTMHDEAGSGGVKKLKTDTTGLTLTARVKKHCRDAKIAAESKRGRIESLVLPVDLHHVSVSLICRA